MVSFGALKRRGMSALFAFVGAIVQDPEVRVMCGASGVGAVFENYAYSRIGEPEASGRKFNATILTPGKNEDLCTGGHLRLNFSKRASFGGKKRLNAFPTTLDIGTYYVPKSKHFAAVDSFGFGSGSDTLFFFQMKSAGVEAVNGTKVEHYYRTASKAVSFQRCVFVYVVPAEVWKKASSPSGDWLEGAGQDFKSECTVCVIAVPSSCDRRPPVDPAFSIS